MRSRRTGCVAVCGDDAKLHASVGAFRDMSSIYGGLDVRLHDAEKLRGGG